MFISEVEATLDFVAVIWADGIPAELTTKLI